VRKLAIALSFLGPAKIVLLDEPTASLDPVARHHVHEMIVDYKGEKTFMLCTHLLSEAETLCDMISIMIKGCVYTVGSPGYLSDKFGTEYKVDVMLKDETEETGRKCDEFFQAALPSAKLSITRPKARIYNVPANELTLPQLFTAMEKGKQGDGGFTYYTCSSSSLERVFMEIVRMSECDDIVFQGD
jgi:ABC-type multidrug transport system ATPase subunit